MKQIFLSVIVLFALSEYAYTQTDTGSVYQNLETKNFYAVSLESGWKKGVYKVNNKRVSKHVYEKYKSTWKNMETCCPCILKSYNVKGRLIEEGVYCTDAGVGWFKTYYKNGNVRLAGSYKENPTGDWKKLCERGYCNVRHGQWTYFNKKGDTLYSEFWNNGEFIKQVPEQNKVQLWKVELTLDGQEFKEKEIDINQIKNLKVNLRYKTIHIDSKITIKATFSTIGYMPKSSTEKQFSNESFQNIDAVSMISESKAPQDKKIFLCLKVYSNNEIVRYFQLEVKR